MGKLISETIRMLEQAMFEWKTTCPGAGWEHHQTSALVTLAMTPAMTELLRLAAVGYAVEQASEQAVHVDRRMGPSSSPLEAEREG